MVTNYLTLVLTEGSLTRWTEDGHSSLVGSRQEFDMQLHVVFWSSGITRLVLGILPMGFFPRTPSFTNLSFVDAPNPLTGHSYLLHTLHIFAGTRGLIFGQNVPSPWTHSPDCLSSSVRSSMLHRPIPPPPLA